MRRSLIYSPAVRAMLSLRMDAAHGTPTIWEKMGALLGLEGKEDAPIIAGEEHDLSAAEEAVLGVLQPLLHGAEGEAMGDITTVIQKVLAGAGSIGSIGSAVSLVESAVKSEEPVLQEQIAALGKTSLTTLVSAVLATLGHTDLPI